jgi:hypothetical protein
MFSKVLLVAVYAMAVVICVANNSRSTAFARGGRGTGRSASRATMP